MRRKTTFLLHALLILGLGLYGCRLTAPSWALPLNGHISTANQYVWGLTTEASEAIHSAIIDKVPWRSSYGGSGHRDLWGHSDAWFYEGKLPKAMVLQDIRNANPKVPEEEIQRIFREATAKSGKARIAEELKKQFSNLSQKEVEAIAEQLHAAHIIGDSTTAEGAKLTNIEHARSIVSSPQLDAVTGENKMAMAKAMENTTPEAFVRQPINFERLKVEQIMRDTNAKGFNPAGRLDTGFEIGGQKYVYKAGASRVQDAIRRNSNTKVVLPDDEYTRFINNRRNAAHVDRVVPESQITNKTNTLQGSQTQCTQQIIDGQLKLVSAQASFAGAVRQKIKQVAPYAIGGALMALSENWEILSSAYQGEEEWEKALTRTGVDFAGYTVTPMVIDGVLAKAGNNMAIIAPLKNAGLAYTIGYWAWGSGKEYYAYQTGDITSEEMWERVKSRTGAAASQVVAIPINMLVLKIVGVATTGTFVVPIVVIGVGAGVNYIYQRGWNWYQEKKWEQTIYMEDILAVLGPDLVEAFTLATPERRASLAEPERRASLAEPERKPSLAEPERRDSLAEPIKY